jgi:hypothetical protein
MTHYIVMLHHSCDDYPLYVEVKKAEAMRESKGASWNPPRSKDSWTDASTPICISILTVNHGVVDFGHRDVVRVWEDETEEVAS